MTADAGKKIVTKGRASTFERILTALYLLWAAACFGIVLAKDGLTPDVIVHLAALAYLGASVFAIPLLRKLAERHGPRTVFLGACIVSAMVVETFYMFTKPLHPSLLIDAHTSAMAALRSLGVDWTLTFPAYVLIFATIWVLIRRYDYRPVEFAVLMAAGQAIGDGIEFFSGNPGMLIFLPYQMLNYHAMTLIPFIALRDRVHDERSRRGLPMFVLPLIVLPVVYFIAGSIIMLLGRAVGWID